ncbi:MAG: hypothetical protein AAF671_12125, partial [Pseudomonadota bacterium]
MRFFFVILPTAKKKRKKLAALSKWRFRVRLSHEPRQGQTTKEENTMQYMLLLFEDESIMNRAVE